jgi:hypothetical protein
MVAGVIWPRLTLSSAAARAGFWLAGCEARMSWRGLLPLLIAMEARVLTAAEAPGLLVAPNATDVTRSNGKGTASISYYVKERFPATATLAFFQTTLQDRGWRPLGKGEASRFETASLQPGWTEPLIDGSQSHAVLVGALAWARQRSPTRSSSLAGRPARASAQLRARQRALLQQKEAMRTRAAVAAGSTLHGSRAEKPPAFAGALHAGEAMRRDPERAGGLAGHLLR